MQFLQTTIVTGVWWQQTIVILMLVMLNNVPNVFGNADNGQQQSYHSDDNNNADRSGKQPVYEEFFIEHNVSQKDAIKSFKEYAQKLLLTNKPVPSWCATMPCTENIMAYCLNGSMLHDHCCCDSRHRSEQLPWIPHSCYVGQRQSCKPKIGSCIAYTEYRECCCDRALARRWNKIYSKSSKMTTNNYVLLAVIAAFLSASSTSVWS